jgi:hypothetical protein
MKFFKTTTFLALAIWPAASPLRAGEKIRIAVGTQDTTINCAAGGPVVRELHLLEKYLPHDGKYHDAEYELTWLNLPTGAQLNSEVLAGRLDIVQMADFPATVGHSACFGKKRWREDALHRVALLRHFRRGQCVACPERFAGAEHQRLERKAHLGAGGFHGARVFAARHRSARLGSGARCDHFRADAGGRRLGAESEPD